MGYPASAKLYIVSAPYAPFRKHLKKRGWYENPDFFSPYFHLKYCVRLKDIDYRALVPHQMISHFVGQNCLTNKFELSRSLTNLISDSNIDIDRFFPRCYDINCYYDHLNFLIDFKISYCLVNLKKYLREMLLEKSRKVSKAKNKRKSKSFNDSQESKVGKTSVDKNRKDSKAKKNRKISFKKVFSKSGEILICKNLVAITSILRYCDFLENRRFVKEIISETEYQFISDKMHYQTEIGWTHANGPKYVVKAIDNIKQQVKETEGDSFDLSEIIPIDDESLMAVQAEYLKSDLEQKELNNKELIDIIDENDKDTSSKTEIKNTDFQDMDLSQKDAVKNEYDIQQETKESPIDGKKSKPSKKDQLSLELVDTLVRHSIWTLRKYKSLNPQYDLLGTENLWIQKPNGLSRGRGIQVFKSLNEIEAYWAACDCEMVVMKYIERPLLIRRRKFDIRHWVVISNLDPLCIWSFEDYYIRLSLDDYSEGDPNNVYAHLTNNSVAKKNKKLYSQIYAHSMLTKRQFLDFCKERNGAFEASKFHGDMHQLLIHSVQSGKFNLVPRKRSFTVLGFDLMVDVSFKLWLIEVNSSPSMDTNTNVTEKIVPEFFRNLAEAVCDYNFVGNTNLSVGTRVGKLRLICKKNRKI